MVDPAVPTPAAPQPAIQPQVKQTAAAPANPPPGSFLQDVIFVCCGTIGAAYLFFLLVGVPMVMIYVGFTTTDECPAGPMITYYLIVSGGMSVLRTVWYFLEFWIFRRRIGFTAYNFIDNFACAATAFMVTWYILGLYWVVSIAWPNLDDERDFNYCDPAAYLIAFVTLMGILVLLLIWCTCVCTLAFQVVPVVNERFAEVGIPVPVPPRPRANNAVTVYVVETLDDSTVINIVPSAVRNV